MGLLVAAMSVPTLALAELRMIKFGAADIAVERFGDRGPVVVFESGLGTPMESFRGVAEALSSCMQVVLYDRPGIGLSGPRPEQGPVTAGEAADRLHELIAALGLPAPRIIVGHSLGGFNAQIYARRTPKDVAAVVLIDAASQFEPEGAFVSASNFAPGSIEALEDEGFDLGVAAVAAEPPFPPVPLIVLAATDHAMPAQTEKLWLETQAKIAALSPEGRLEIIEGSGHYIQTDKPDTVIAAVIAAARQAGLATSDCAP
jgi:pimeloyl-ACP methyl ester carboxylesterase